MPINSSIQAFMLGATACLFAGCSTPGSLAPTGQPGPAVNRSVAGPAFTPSQAQQDFGRSVQPALGARCKVFASIFAEAAACERANGTLDSFQKTKIAWHVRYFVRHWEMPCHEAPTEQEEYVFHMVTEDLYTDSDLNDTERVAIRNAMFDGKVHCKT